LGPNTCIERMPKFEFCLPILGKIVPAVSGFTRLSLRFSTGIFGIHERSLLVSLHPWVAGGVGQCRACSARVVGGCVTPIPNRHGMHAAAVRTAHPVLFVTRRARSGCRSRCKRSFAKTRTRLVGADSGVAACATSFGLCRNRASYRPRSPEPSSGRSGGSGV
jgi:hypothetical protein